MPFTATTAPSARRLRASLSAPSPLRRGRGPDARGAAAARRPGSRSSARGSGGHRGRRTPGRSRRTARSRPSWSGPGRTGSPVVIVKRGPQFVQVTNGWRWRRLPGSRRSARQSSQMLTSGLTKVRPDACSDGRMVKDVPPWTAHRRRGDVADDRERRGLRGEPSVERARRPRAPPRPRPPRRPRCSRRTRTGRASGPARRRRDGSRHPARHRGRRCVGAHGRSRRSRTSASHPRRVGCRAGPVGGWRCTGPPGRRAVNAVGWNFPTSCNLRLGDSARYRNNLGGSAASRPLLSGESRGQPLGVGDGLAEDDGDGFPDGLALPASTRALRTRSRAAPWAFA